MRLFSYGPPRLPDEQIRTFLWWFSQQAVHQFDIHVKKPKKTGEEWIWLTHHESVSAEYINSSLLKWLKYENVIGAEVYFRGHSNGEHRVVFLDDVPTRLAIAVLKKYGACAVETHPGNTQIWLAVDRPLDKQQRRQAQTILRDLGFTDPRSISGDHLGRLCGFRSQKRRCWVNVLGMSMSRPWSPTLSTANPQSPQSLPHGGGACASKMLTSHEVDDSHSGREWGWVLGMIRSGLCPEIVERKLIAAAKARGKANALKYAHRTVEKALACVGKVTRC